MPGVTPSDAQAALNSVSSIGAAAWPARFARQDRKTACLALDQAHFLLRQTLAMRPLLRRLALCPLLAATLATASEPPGFLPWRTYEEPDFPPQLLSTGVLDGFASVMFTFDDQGQITDRVAIAASHPAFTLAVFEAIQKWEIDPARLAGSRRREFIRYDFKRGQHLLTMGQRDANKTVLSAFGDQAAIAIKTCGEAEADRPLEELAAIAVEYPPQLKQQKVRGSATVSFVADAGGRVRVPTVTDATEPEFGAAVLAAIRQLRFVPPSQNGHPVQVLAERTFRFELRHPDT